MGYYRMEDEEQIQKEQPQESKSETESSIETDEEDFVDDYTSNDITEEEDVPIIDKDTHRLAIVNLDWSQLQVRGGKEITGS